ncbi:MAG: hypothetical protein FWD53_01540 [Phycisphaerales bacterium]|nr:hypothetical protein [Phycisphaerales bacterium]
MKRHQLEHILRAVGAITGSDRFVIIGSQAILGQFPNPPAELLASFEADIFSPTNRDEATLIDGCIGEGSPFHQTFGYYAHGVGEETATLPKGWKNRLIPVTSKATNGTTGLCLEVHDLAISKLIAGRPKDLQFVSDLIRHRLANPEILQQRLEETELDQPIRDLCTGRLSRIQTTDHS